MGDIAVFGDKVCSTVKYLLQFSSCSLINTLSLRSSTSNNIYVQRPMSHFGKRTFHYPGTTLWNSIPITLKESKRLDHFKEAVRFIS